MTTEGFDIDPDEDEEMWKGTGGLDDDEMDEEDGTTLQLSILILLILASLRFFKIYFLIIISS